MIDEIGTDRTLAALHGALSRTSIRSAVTASNLVNAETPGYRAKRVEFQQLLGSTGDPARAADGARVVEAAVTRMRQDGNTVDMDVEMTRFAQLQGRFRTATQLVRKRFALMRYAMTDGRG